MKNGWVLKRLGEVCDIKTGKKDVNQGNPNGKYPFFTCAREHTYSDDFSFDTEALLIAGNGDVGNVSYFKGKFEAYQRTYVLFNFRDVLPISLYFYLDGYLKQTVSNQKLGNTMPYIKIGMLLDFQIPVPPLAEQTRLVAKLDTAFAALALAKTNAEKNLQNAKGLFESFLNGIFENKGDGWEEKRLGEVCEISSKLIDPKKAENQDLIHIGAGNIESKKGTLIDLQTAKEEGLISGKFLFDEKMVLYSKIRPYLMKVVKCEFKGLCSADIYPLVPFEKEMTRDFLYYLLLTENFTQYAIKGSQRAGMPKVNREHLFEFRFFVPKIKTQQTIVTQLDALSTETKRLETVYQEKIAALDELKKSILERAFAGEL